MPVKDEYAPVRRGSVNIRVRGKEGSDKENWGSALQTRHFKRSTNREDEGRMSGTGNTKAVEERRATSRTYFYMLSRDS